MTSTLSTLATLQELGGRNSTWSPNGSPQRTWTRTGDPGDQDAAWREAELLSFLHKSNEREWVSKTPNEDVRFNPDDLLGVLVVSPSAVPSIEKALLKEGYLGVKTKAMSEGVRSLMRASLKKRQAQLRLLS